MSHPSKRISQQELESYLWGAAVLLRGLIDAGDYKQFIFPLLFYKRVSDVWEEEYQAALANSNGDLSYAQFAENHRFQIPQGAHWNDIRQAPKNVGAAIQKAMHAIETANPDLLEGTRERTQSFLKLEHQQRILAAYKTFADVPGFAKVATLTEIGVTAGNLSIPLYVKQAKVATIMDSNGHPKTMARALEMWTSERHALWSQITTFLETLDGLTSEESVDG